MKTTRWILLAALTLGLAGSASAAGKAPNLAVGGRTLAGPGAVALTPGGSVTVFAAPAADPADVCITVANTGKLDVGVNVSGANAPSLTVAPGSTQATCDEDVTAVSIFCMQERDCAAQWRVDDK
jgi:hypothetical protein